MDSHSHKNDYARLIPDLQALILSRIYKKPSKAINQTSIQLRFLIKSNIHPVERNIFTKPQKGYDPQLRKLLKHDPTTIYSTKKKNQQNTIEA